MKILVLYQNIEKQYGGSSVRFLDNDGWLNRRDGPANIQQNGEMQWYKNGLQRGEKYYMNNKRRELLTHDY